MDLLKELPLGVLAVVRLMMSQVCKTMYSRTIVRCSTYNGMQHMQRRRDGWRVSVSVGTIVATRRHRYQHRFSVALKHVIVKCQSACCTTCSVHNVPSLNRYNLDTQMWWKSSFFILSKSPNSCTQGEVWIEGNLSIYHIKVVGPPSQITNRGDPFFLLFGI